MDLLLLVSESLPSFRTVLLLLQKNFNVPLRTNSVGYHGHRKVSPKDPIYETVDCDFVWKYL